MNKLYTYDDVYAASFEVSVSSVEQQASLVLKVRNTFCCIYTTCKIVYMCKNYEILGYFRVEVLCSQIYCQMNRNHEQTNLHTNECKTTTKKEESRIN